MKPEMGRFFLAVTLMMAVVVGTNVLFPPPPPPEEETAEPGPVDPSLSGEELEFPERRSRVTDRLTPEIPNDVPDAGDVPEELVWVEGPLYRMSFSSYGATARSIRLSEYPSFTRDGFVELVPAAAAVLGGRWIEVGSDSVDLTRFPHTVTPEGGIRLAEGDGPRTLTFRYDHPGGSFFSEIRYTFSPDSYIVQVEGELPGLGTGARASILRVDLGPGLALNEVREQEDLRMMAFSGHHPDEGIKSRPMSRVKEPDVLEGPLRWAAVKSKFFLHAVLPGGGNRGDLLGSVWAAPGPEEGRASIRVDVPVTPSGTYAYRTFLGPMERELLVGIGDDLEEVNPYGWRFFRPVIRPFVGVILWTINFFHNQLLLGYGWVLMIIGVLMRVVLWPLNQKAMRAQIRNMAVQPLVQEIRTKYANDPKRTNQEMMKLYKEHGFNPLAGCLPMLIPWPMLIALFFVFQNTIQLRGESFLWLPDLSAPDPWYILPFFLGISMFLLQFISMRSMGTSNPQMKMMMYVMPVVMVVIFFRFASGLNLYYATVNIATIPQQVLIARERKKASAAAPLKSRT